MKILAWNVNHRAARRPIPAWLIQAIAAESPDLVSLTEYVVGPDHDRFLSELAATGLIHTELTTRVNGSNQVLAAARELLLPGEIKPPELHESIPPNFLHVRTKTSGIEVIAFRMSAYDGVDKPMKRRTWEWLVDALESIQARPAIVVGDFNTAHGDPVARCGDCLETLAQRGWTPVVPAEGFSWGGRNGGPGRKIDFAFASPSLRVNAVSYCWAFRELGGEAAAMRVGRPDHAMLLVEVTARSA